MQAKKVYQRSEIVQGKVYSSTKTSTKYLYEIVGTHMGILSVNIYENGVWDGRTIGSIAWNHIDYDYGYPKDLVITCPEHFI